MIGVYFSGTGNTKHCVEKLTALLDADAKVIPLESSIIKDEIEKNNEIIFGYPIQYSNLPYLVKDFILSNQSLWVGKTVFCLATMGAFSGDGAGCSARLFRKCGACVWGGLHLKMPDSVCDSKLLKKSMEENKELIRQADRKIEQAAKQIRQGNAPKEGLNFLSHMTGLFGQRLWFYSKTVGCTDRLKIGEDCIGCGLCVSVCPMANISLKEKKAVAGKSCTMCYRCISLCPQKVITLLGKQVTEQCRYEKYAEGLIGQEEIEER